MDAEMKRKWVEALRSGRYEQGTGYLKKDGKYCCLGVLCETAGLESRPDRFDASKYRFVDPGDGPGYQGDVCYLPPALRKRVGISGIDETNLSEMNDEKGSNFSEIAGWIEQKL